MDKIWQWLWTEPQDSEVAMWYAIIGGIALGLLAAMGMWIGGV